VTVEAPGAVALRVPTPGRAVFAVAGDLLREAASRKWFLAFGGAITLALATLGFSLRLDVLDGALAATRFFGKDLQGSIMSVDVFLRPIYQATAYLIFYGGSAFGILACADFAPSLLSPGRIEHLLSLPVRRWELLLGTFFGVLTIALCGALYGAGGLVLILGIKSGYWTARPLIAAVLGGLSFAGIYAAMLTVALFVRSAALSAAAGGLLFLGGVIASYRQKIAPLFEPGLGRMGFKAATALLPRVSALADTAAQIAAEGKFDHPALSSLLGGLALFAAAVLTLAIWRFEHKDF
jgi:hypothetical protein